MNPRMRSTISIAVLGLSALLGSQTAGAWSACTDFFNATYPNSDTATLAGCQTCHQNAGGGAFNVYGDDLLANGADGAGLNCNAVDFVAALRGVEALDSDGEGNINIVEIEASTQPGWCDETQSTMCSNSPGTPPDTALDPAPANGLPVADAGGPYSGESGNTLIQFDGSASSDPDNDSLTYAWDFGDGNTGTGQMPTYTYMSAGTFQVTLVVNDGQADSEPDFASAEISAPPVNLAPVADPGGPYIGEPGQAVAFDGTGSTDPNDDPLTYSWDFGDGSMGDGAMPTHVYDAAGNYSVSLVVNDGEFDSNIAMTTAMIELPPANRAPVANTGGPYSGVTGMVVEFDGRESNDPDGDALTYVWDFGDGTMGDGATTTHAYGTAGTYDVMLTVNDGEFDNSATTTASIEDPTEEDDGAVLYGTYCASCHADPWNGPAVDDSLAGLRRVAGARYCNIYGSIFGTSVFPNGVPEMQFLQGLTEAEIEAMAEYLNSMDASGEQRYVTTCAGCHGNDGSGGRTDEDVHGDSAHETLEAIEDDEEMQYLACMPVSDIESISEFLATLDDDFDDDGIDDDEDSDDDSDGIDDDEDSDDDNDGRSDDEEREDGTDPRDDDTDSDGLDDGEEHERGTDPLDKDSDDDGVSDGDEVKIHGTDPLVANGTSNDSLGGSGGGPANPLLILLLLVSLIMRRKTPT